MPDCYGNFFGFRRYKKEVVNQPYIYLPAGNWERFGAVRPGAI